MRVANIRTVRLEKIWLSVAEAAEYAGVSGDTIYTACERREIHYARIGGSRTIRLKAEWIDAWRERHARRADDWRSEQQSA
jgi:excisionase family DNA binding protein